MFQLTSSQDTSLRLREIHKMFLKSALILALAVTLSHGYNFSILYEWTQIEFEYSDDTERTKAISNGSFAVGTIQPIDVQYAFVKDQNESEIIFITTPRLGDGIPASLSVITDNVLNGNPIVRPYPSWSWHQNPESCNYERIVSVFRVWVDECQRLWVLDNGIIGATFTCTPQLLAFNLSTNELLYKYEIPYEQYLNTSWYLTPTVEVEDSTESCLETWVYVADPTAPSLLVYSLEQNTSWALYDSSFNASSNWSTFSIAGDSFTVADGILTVALTPPSEGADRILRYHAMSNINESYVYVKDLKNSSNFDSDYSDLFYTYEGKRDQQSCIEAIDSNGTVYFSLLSDIEIAKWVPTTTYEKENFEIIGSNRTTMQFPSGLKVGPYQGGEALWAFSTSFQRYAAGTLTSNETNFRILFTEL